MRWARQAAILSGPLIYVLRYALIALYTVVWGIPATLVAPLPGSGELIVFIGRQWVRWIFRSCGIHVEVEGLEHVDRDGPQIIMTNHQSVVDIGALITVLPVSWRFVAKRELTWIPFFGWALGLSDQIIIDRGRRERAVASLRRAAERVRGGRNVIIFPEGTRSPDGTLRAFKSGGFHLALQAQVPIVPATVSGSHLLTPKGSLRIESGRVKVSFAPPIATAGLDVEDREALKERVRQAILAGYDPELQVRPAAASVGSGRAAPA